MKKIFNKQSVSAIIFLAILFLCFFGTLLKEARGIASVTKNTLLSGTGYKKSVSAITAKIETAFKDGLYGSLAFIDVYSASQALLGVSRFEDAAVGDIIKDTHGNLHFTVARQGTSVYADSLGALKKSLDEDDIPLLYVQAPGKKLKDYTVFPAGAYNFANENADEFLSAAVSYGIGCFDLREEIISDNLNPDGLFYKTDHHWQTETAFWAFIKTAGYLEETLGFSFDPAALDSGSYERELFKDCFLGSLGKRIGRFSAGIDDYTLIKPSFDTDYLIYDGAVSATEPIWSGPFDGAIVKRELLDSPDITTNRYAAYFKYDFGHMIIKNTSVKNDYKILLIKDSFALPFSAFLSTCVSELTMIDLRDFNADSASLDEYIKEYKPDLVMFLYNPEAYSPEMFNFFD